MVATLWSKEPPLSWFGYGGLTPADQLAELVPALLNFEARCPACFVESGILFCLLIGRAIQHLNDHHHWSRELIADWLETLDIDLTFQPAQKGD